MLRPTLSYRTSLACILLAGSASAQTFTVQPQQVSLAAQPGSAAAVTTVNVLSSEPSRTFSASVRYLGTATGWLSVNPATGATPASVSISANPSGLAAGTHLGQVNVTSGNLGAVVNVFFTVGPASGGSLAVTPSGLTFFGQAGVGILPAQTLSVTNIAGGAGPVTFNAFATSAESWLSVSPMATTPATLEVVAIQTGLSPGIHNGTITIIPVGGGNPTVVPVTLTAVGTVSERLTLSQTALTINHQTGASPPPVQKVRVSTTTSAFRDYSATTSAMWLRLVSAFSPIPSGTVTDLTPGEFRVSIEPTGLAPGTYVGTIAVSSFGLPSEELSVSLTVTTGPALNADPSSIFFDGAVTTGIPVTVTSTGTSNLSFTAAVSPPESWLMVTPATGSTSAGSAALTVTVNPGRPAGTYNGVVILTVPGSGATFRIPVRMIVTGVAGSAGTLELSTTSITLTGVAGLSNPSETIDVRVAIGDPINVGTAALNFTAAASSTGGWLTVSPLSGTAPTRLTVTANPAIVSGPGTYQGSVVVTSLTTGDRQTVTVTLNLAERAIVAEPASLTFTQQERGVAPPSQSVRIGANSPSTFTVTEVSNGIRVSPSSGPTPSTLTVWADISVLPPGSTGGRILITGPNNQITIPVSLMILEPPMPTVTVEALTFAYQLGSPAPAPQSINVASTAEAVGFTATATTSTGVNWLSVSPPTGTTPATLTTTVNPAMLVPGRQTGTISIAAADRSIPPRTVAVTVNVAASSAAIEGVLHGARLVPGAVAPGQIVVITGTGIGPASGVSARPTAAGAIETRLADTRVLFDGVPAPLLFVRSDQINAIVPYTLQGRPSARVQIETGTNFSLPIETKVVDVAPGIFTANSSGRGQAAALNSDFMPNSAANPAQRGSVIAVYGTGEGQTDPPGQDGRIIVTDLRRPLQQVTATIGGRPAEVTYAGSASTLVSGVFQANIRIPEDVEPGTVSLEIQVGGVATQSGVTVVVR